MASLGCAGTGSAGEVTQGRERSGSAGLAGLGMATRGSAGVVCRGEVSRRLALLVWLVKVGTLRKHTAGKA